MIRSHFRKLNVLPRETASEQMTASARITKSNHPEPHNMNLITTDLESARPLREGFDMCSVKG